jgi:hypothetical protein
MGRSRAGRYLQAIRRDMDLKGLLMRHRLRNEEILSLSYQEGGMVTGAAEAELLKKNILNLPFRYVRWLESQATSKKMVVKVGRDAGEGQRPGGPADTATGMWLGIALQRVAYIAGFRREVRALIGEVCPRGTSVIRIGYHEQHVTLEEAREAGKDAQSVAPEVLGMAAAAMEGMPADPSALDAKRGQAHAQIAEGLGEQASDPMLQMAGGSAASMALLARAESHVAADLKAETDRSPTESTRMLRHRVWMQKKRVGEDVGWAPWVYDTEDTPFWWERNVWTVAQVKASPLFSGAFKKVVEGYDGRNVSGVASGGQTPSTDSMGSDARQAQSEDVLDEDERSVEWFSVWIRRPDMKAGGIVKIVCAEAPEMFVEADDSNPFVDADGYALIPGFYPFYDFTPLLSSITVPERTTGIPPVGVGMPQIEKIAEYNRLRRESALRHSLRLYELHEELKGNQKLLNALKNGEDGYAYFRTPGMRNVQGQAEDGITPIQFTGNTQEIDRQAAREEADWIKVQGMPPAILQGMGTADTLGQDEQGIAAGERESGALVAYFEERMGDVLAGIRGLMRNNYDDEDWIPMLGAEGAAVMKAWQTSTADDGDEITVTFGARAQAQEAVERKQLMEAITLEKGEIEPLTGLPTYDPSMLFEELHRRLDVGPPVKSAGVIPALQQMVMRLSAALQQVTGGAAPGGPPGGGGMANDRSPSGSGPSRAEGDAPSNANIGAGARRGTLPPAPRGAAPNGATNTY